METKTDLANRALSMLGEAKISDIGDDSVEAARVCNEHVDAVIAEILRSHRWNVAIDRAILTKSGDSPAFGYSNAFVLPSDFVRLLSINGEAYETQQEFFEIEANNRLLSNWETCKIRYVKDIPIVRFDPLMAEATAAKLAMVISVPLTGSPNKQQQAFSLFQVAISNAKTVDAYETSSGENRTMEATIRRSRLVQSRYVGNGGFWFNRYVHPFRY